MDCQPALWQVRADPGEIGRAIMNLSLNARDAMPGGGTLTIATANATLTEAGGGNPELRAGPLREDGGARHGDWDGCGDADASLRAVLHHQGCRQGNRPGTRHRSGNCRAERRRHSLRVRTGPGKRLYGLPAGHRRDGGPGSRSGRRSWPRRPRVRKPCCWWRTKRRSACWPAGFWRRWVTWFSPPATAAKAWRCANPTRAPSICW